MLSCPHCKGEIVIQPLVDDPDLSDPDLGYSGRNVMHGLTPRTDLLGQEIREHWIGLHVPCWQRVEIINGRVARSIFVFERREAPDGH